MKKSKKINFASREIVTFINIKNQEKSTSQFVLMISIKILVLVLDFLNFIKGVPKNNI